MKIININMSIYMCTAVRVNFSRPQGVRIEMNRIIVTEGVDPYLKLLVQAFDFFAHGFMVGVACTPSSSTDTSPGKYYLHVIEYIYMHIYICMLKTIQV